LLANTFRSARTSNFFVDAPPEYLDGWCVRLKPIVAQMVPARPPAALEEPNPPPALEQDFVIANFGPQASAPKPTTSSISFRNGFVPRKHVTPHASRKSIRQCSIKPDVSPPKWRAIMRAATLNRIPFCEAIKRYAHLTTRPHHDQTKTRVRFGGQNEKRKRIGAHVSWSDAVQNRAPSRMFGLPLNCMQRHNQGRQHDARFELRYIGSNGSRTSFGDLS
jgi:hypothetical protein